MAGWRRRDERPTDPGRLPSPARPRGAGRQQPGPRAGAGRQRFGQGRRRDVDQGVRHVAGARLDQGHHGAGCPATLAGRSRARRSGLRRLRGLRPHRSQPERTAAVDRDLRPCRDAAADRCSRPLHRDDRLGGAGRSRGRARATAARFALGIRALHQAGTVAVTSDDARRGSGRPRRDPRQSRPRGCG